MYTPSGEIVPCDALPPGIPETLQVTAVFDVFDTVAANVTAFPSSTDWLVGATLTEIGCGPGGGGGGGGVTLVAPAHPIRSAHTAAVKQMGARLHPPGARAPRRFTGVMDYQKQCLCQREPADPYRRAPRFLHRSTAQLST